MKLLSLDSKYLSVALDRANRHGLRPKYASSVCNLQFIVGWGPSVLKRVRANLLREETLIPIFSCKASSQHLTAAISYIRHNEKPTQDIYITPVGYIQERCRGFLGLSKIELARTETSRKVFGRLTKGSHSESQGGSAATL